MAHDTRPELPEFIPHREDEIIRVEDERHRYEVFDGDSDSKLPKYEYTLDKAPAVEIEEVSGTSDGQEKTFVEGADYALTPFTSERVDTFTFRNNRREYALTTVPDDNSTTIEDENGNTFDENIDFAIVESDGTNEENVIDWTIGGTQPESQVSFTTRYTVTFENGHINWDQGGDTPDAGTYFYVTYRAPSIISRYIDGATEELDSLEDELEQIIQAKFVDTAQGIELDRIGETFGDLGKRRGRNDTQYRIYLKSVVQSFVSRGTKTGIKRAVSAATDVPFEDITINEDFQNNEYEVEILAATPITGSLLEEVAEIADPSGVELELTRFTIPKEEIAIDDRVSMTEGMQVGPDTTGSTDAFLIDQNKTDAGVDSAGSDDTIADITQQVVQWEISDWDEMYWAVEHN